MTSKTVSRKYALNEFNTTGLILIIYCLFVLFLPLVIGELFEMYAVELEWHGLNTVLLIKTALMIIGTVLPFALLKLSSRRKSRKQEKLPISSKQIVCQAVVFFTASSAAIFAMTAIAAYFGFSGELVSGIGISINSEYLTDVVYVITFIFISPVLEEFAFRGALLSTLSKYGKYFALVSSSIIFALAHGSFLEFIPSFIMGLLLGKIALRYKTIKPTIMIHIIFNILLYVSFIIPESASMVIAGFYGILYLLAIALVATKTYKRIVVRKSNSSGKVMSMFLTTFPVMISIFLFIAHSILTVLLKM